MRFPVQSRGEIYTVFDEESDFQVENSQFRQPGPKMWKNLILKNLVFEFCNKNLDKRQGSSDWNKDLDELTDKQLEYAAGDVIYLHKIKAQLEKMLVREKRMDLFKRCISFLDTRIELDQNGFKFDIFEH